MLDVVLTCTALAQGYRHQTILGIVDLLAYVMLLMLGRSDLGTQTRSLALMVEYHAGDRVAVGLQGHIAPYIAPEAFAGHGYDIERLALALVLEQRQIVLGRSHGFKIGQFVEHDLGIRLRRKHAVDQKRRRDRLVERLALLAQSRHDCHLLLVLGIGVLTLFERRGGECQQRGHDDDHNHRIYNDICVRVLVHCHISVILRF